MAGSTTVMLGESAVTRIGLGTNRLTVSPENVDFIRKAVAACVDMIDTAHIYAGGESEQAIGGALSPRPEGCVVATKGGFSAADAEPEALRAQIEESLERLRTERIDLYYLHRVHPDVGLERSLAVIDEYREAGRIRYIGISEVGVEQIERARAVVPVAAVQNHYNLSERRHEEVVDHCAAEGIVFVPYFPLRGTGSSELAQIAASHEATETQIALAWLLMRSPAMLPIPGTLSLAHLRENLEALEIELTDAEFQALA
ncbi:MAG: aldo/keto reductase [Acidobacteriota bacterium]|nr:aldo/keto reductase [Acidobacteriota bacterium]